jgi:hypothetical protein
MRAIVVRGGKYNKIAGNIGISGAIREMEKKGDKW